MTERQRLRPFHVFSSRLCQCRIHALYMIFGFRRMWGPFQELNGLCYRPHTFLYLRVHRFGTKAFLRNDQAPFQAHFLTTLGPKKPGHVT